jgi:23S rRNA (uracil1939-C5)-methyltransferase
MLVLSITEFSEKVENLLNQVKNEFPFITSLFYVINTKRNDTISDLTPVLFSGKDHILEIFENPLNQKVKYRIGPKSFFQTNSNQAQELYKLAFNLAQPKANETMYDLYTGTGSIALFFANAVKKVVGVEYVEEAIEDAKINAQLNDIENVSFFAGDMKDIFTEDFIAANGTPDLVVTDPPRAGMHADVVAQLAKLKPNRILYISCNPATQARDLIELTPFYDVIESQSVDMFPHTNHVENITLLHLKS